MPSGDRSYTGFVRPNNPYMERKTGSDIVSHNCGGGGGPFIINDS